MAERTTDLDGAELPPDPDVLLRSLRGIGYSVEDAVADVVDNSLSAGASQVGIWIRDAQGDVIVDIVDDGDGLSRSDLLIALSLGAQERDSALVRNARDLGRFGLGLKTASFSVAKRLSVLGRKGGVDAGAAWDLEVVRRTRKWQLSALSPEDFEQLSGRLGARPSGTAVRWSNTDRLQPAPGTDRLSALSSLERRIRGHLGMIFHRFISGLDPDGQEIPQAHVTLNDLAIDAWNPLLPLTERPHLVEFGEVKHHGDVRLEYAILPPDTQMNAEERKQASPPGRRLTDMQGFYVYRANRLVCPASWLNLPGSGRGRWNKESATQLARISVDLTNASDEEWSLDVRKSRVSPPDRHRSVLVNAGNGARARSKSRIFGRRGPTTEPTIDQPLLSLWTLNAGQLQISRDHPLVRSIIEPGTDASPRTLQSSVRSLLRMLETSPALVALVAEPAADATPASGSPEVLDDADFGEALDLATCLRRGRVPLKTVLEIVSEDPRYRNNPALLERLRARLEKA